MKQTALNELVPVSVLTSSAAPLALRARPERCSRV